MTRLTFLAIVVTLTLTGVLFAREGKSQSLEETSVSLNFKDIKLDQILSNLEKQSGFTFTYTQKIGNLGPFSIKVDRQTLLFTLKKLATIGRLSFQQNKLLISISQPPPAIPPPPGVIEGNVYDAKTKETLIGAVVIINGRSYPTDINGHFKIDLPPGAYNLEVRYVGYTTKQIPGVIVKEKITTSLNVQLQGASTELNTVTVQARRQLNNEISILTDRKNSAVVSDGISAKNIEKTASITTTQALQRVAGVTITDDKYVAIRGLGDRSVIAELNGARLSSSDPDRSAVPLDLVPAALLDNVTIYKTLTPDRPADASAGIVELKTKSVPDALIVTFTSQTGYNSSVGLNGKFNSFSGSDPGFFGQNIKNSNLTPAFLNLKNQYPGGVNQIQQLFTQSRQNDQLGAEAYRINKIMQGFNPVLQTSYQNAVPNQIYTFSIGNTFQVFGDHKLGLIISANYYSRTEDQYHSQLNQYSIYQGVLTGSPQIYSPQLIPPFISPDFVRLGKYLGYQENSGTQTINYGILAGLTYQFDARNEIQFQYIGNRGAQVQGTSLTGAYQNTGLDYPVYNQVNQLKQSFRVFDTFNLQGEHKILNKIWSPQLSYNLSSSKSSQNEPDFRFSDVADKHQVKFIDQTGVGIGTDYYAFVQGRVHGIGPTDSISADPNGRRYRNLNESNYNAKVDLTEPFTVNKRKQEIKFGFNFLKRDRTFTENVLQLPGTDSLGDNGLLQSVHGDLNALASYRNVGLGNPNSYALEGQARTGGYLYQIRKSPNNYTGSYQTKAFYGMIDSRITDGLRFIGGVRFESTDIEANVDTTNVYNSITNNNTSPNNHPNTGYAVGFKPYYSFNLIYQYQKNMNFRLAYSTSLARPELRELTNIYEFDPFQFAVVVGNPNLANQFTKSEDFRWEWFPTSNEVFAVSVFGKQIDHQLTKVFIYNSPGNLATSPEFPIVQFQNDPNMGQVYGIELEARKDLGKAISGLKNIFIGTNILLANSVITKNPARLEAARIINRNSSATSPIFEQAPYALNAYLDYDNPKTGTSITISINMVGERLIQVQLDGAPDIYDRPAPTLDLVFSQKFWKRFVVKGFAKNLLNSPIRQVYADPRTGGTFKGQTYIHNQYYRGAEYSLGLTYNLF